MANTIVILFSIIMLCITAAQGRDKLHSNSEWPKSSSVINDIDGICKTYVETQGYTCEEHKRLPAGRSSEKADKSPVLLQHGLFLDWISWVLNSPDESLGFILADNRYDVWLANSRGTKYSRGHTSLNPNDKAYWDWSWDELTSYDLPAFVQYVYSNTSQKMHYVGHSLVTTEDGYILSLQRIPAGRSGEKANKPPVLLQHGIFSDATTWLVNSPDESLGFILADNGYDVWLANVRGTKYSSGHTSLNPNDKGYWDWSWDELATYDLPAFVQYVYNYTGQTVHYAGHSLGTLMALAALSQGEVLNMLRSAALLCPIAHMNQIPSLPTKLAADLFIANDVYWLGILEFNPSGGGAESKFLEKICNTLNLDCSKLETLVTGPNCCLNSSRTDDSSEPTATKNLIHLSQMIRTGKIAKYDYGDQGQNMQHYGQPVPPVYDMTAIPNEFPLFLSYGGQDLLSDVKDVQVLLNDLKDHDGNKLVVLFKEDYAHLDFVSAVNANQMIYDPMIAFFKIN